VIEANGGQLRAAYALLGENDLVAIVELPDNDQAIRTSIALSKLLGVQFRTVPAVTVEEFDRLLA
jgi:uncharacterized protein with GYD domain